VRPFCGGLGAPNMIELPIDFVTDLTTNANTQIANFSPFILLIMGLLLALIAVGALVKFINK